MEAPFSEEVQTFKNAVILNTFGLFNNDEWADVTFVIDSTDTKEIPAHKLILAMNSTVFRQMFFGASIQTGNIRIIGASADAFIEFLQFFYLTEVRLTVKHLVEVMNLANKYDVPICMSACANFLKQFMVDGTHNSYTLWAYELALFHAQNDLIAQCEGRIQSNPKSIFESSSFKSCQHVILKRILLLNLRCNELLVFNACMDWAKQACERANVIPDTYNCKTMLGDCFQLIRFPTMSHGEFSTALKNHRGLFDIDTLTDIVVHIGSEPSPLPLQVSTQFNTSRRWKILTCTRGSAPDDEKDQMQPIQMQQNPMQRNPMLGRLIGQMNGMNQMMQHGGMMHQGSGQYDYDTPQQAIQQQEVMKFSTNKRIVLEGISMIDIIHRSISIPLNGTLKVFELHSSTKNDLVLSQPINMANTFDSYYALDRPIVIEPNLKYEIQILLQDRLQDQRMFLPFPLTFKKYDNSVSLDGIDFQFDKSLNAKYDCVHYGLMSSFRFSPII